MNLKISIAQINCTVGDISGNTRKIMSYYTKAKAQGADIVCFPELAISGYPPEDLVFKQHFVKSNLLALTKISKKIKDTAAVIGFIDKKGSDIFNAAAFIHNGKILEICHKTLLPNYSVFDEKRYFKSGTKNSIINFKNIKIGLNICEDIWHFEGPIKAQAKAKAKIILNINASPFHVNKILEREKILKNQALKNNVTIVYTNMVGGQDELIFDGQSMIVNNKGKVVARAKSFEEDLLSVETPYMVSLRKEEKPSELASVYDSLVLGVKDYLGKNGFKKAVIGLSGGIDSAIVALIACDAIGKENVMGVSMPSNFSSKETKADAKKIAINLGIEFHEIPITSVMDVYSKTLKNIFKNTKPNITEENIQARIRGNILMAISNKFGHIVLTTGNKSEVAVGYCTLYGDMAGGFAVIKDLPKTLVYEVSRYRCLKTNKELIPESVFTRPPTAELRKNQKDSDSIPEYDILDPVLQLYVEENKSVEEISKKLKISLDIVKKVARLVDINEYKRRQAAPGIKITSRAFGKDRRMPITQKFL